MKDKDIVIFRKIGNNPSVPIDKITGKVLISEIANQVEKYANTSVQELKEKLQHEQHPHESSGIVKFVERVKSGEAKPGEMVVLGEVTDRTRADIEKLTGNKLNATKHVIDVDTIRHIDYRHGVNGVANHDMADSYDYVQIIDVLHNYTRIRLAQNNDGSIQCTRAFRTADNEPAIKVVYEKMYAAGSQMIVVEAISDSKKRVLHIVSAYKTPS